MYSDPITLVPVRHKAALQSIVDEVGFEPTGRFVSANRTDQPIGNELLSTGLQVGASALLETSFLPAAGLILPDRVWTGDG
jgi:hypothetical protein